MRANLTIGGMEFRRRLSLKAGVWAAVAWLVLSSTAMAGPTETTKQTTPAHTYIVGVSPFLDKSVKDDVYRSMIRLVVQDLPLNSTLWIYDAYHLKTITQLTLPNAHVFEAAKT